MERNKQRQYSIKSIDKKLQTGAVRDDYPLQRMSEQHTNAIRDGIIASALNDLYIPEVILCEQVVGEHGEAIYWLIDGKQRWTELAMFRRNQIKLGKNIENCMVSYIHIDEKKNIQHLTFDIRGKRYADLPDELKERYDSFEITGQIFLQCTDAEIEKWIRMFNNTKPMTASQKGITYIGTETASVVKRLSNHDFFRDDYGKFTEKNFRNGDIDRVITEGIIMTSYPESYTKKYETNCNFLRDKATASAFDKFEGYLDRLTEIMSAGGHNTNFNTRDAFIFFGLFDRFQGLGLEDEQFGNFLEDFDSLKEIVIDGMNYEDVITVSRQGTKDRKWVFFKLDWLEKLMLQYFGIEKKEDENLPINNAVTELAKQMEGSCFQSLVKDKAATVAKYLSARYGKTEEEGMADFLSRISITEEFKEDFTLYLNLLEDWTLDVNNNSKFFTEDGIASLLYLTEQVVNADEDDICKEWFAHFVENFDKGFYAEWKDDYTWITETITKSFSEFEKLKKTA